MVKLNRIGKLCLAAAVMFVLLLNTCMCASAARADFSRKCSITFTMSYNGETIPGGSLKMYRIATWVFKDNAYTFEWVPELADAGLDLSQSGSEDFARHVFMLVESRSLPATSRMIGKEGVVTFGDLDSGLYVVYQTEPAKGYEPINAFCVSLPIAIGDTIIYDVQAAPKPRPAKTEPSTPESTTEELPSSGEPTDPPKTTAPSETTVPSESHTTPGETTTRVTNVYESDSPPVSMGEKLPQTGQLWWPTWMLAAFGLILIIFGILLRSQLSQNAEDPEA